MSETSQAITRKQPLHLPNPTGSFVYGEQHAAVTNAQHRMDINRALMFNKGKVPPRQSVPWATMMPPSSSSSPEGGSPKRDQAEEQPSSPQGARTSALPMPAKANRHIMLGYGDTDEVEGFPGAPNASRGFPGGGHTKWSFERVPSLLPPHLERDRGMRGRSCAGNPPAASLLPSGSAASMSPVTCAWHASTIAGGDMRKSHPGPFSGLQRVRSTGAIQSGHMHVKGGLQGVIGTTWDNAKTTAGGSLRGSDGRFLGY